MAVNIAIQCFGGPQDGWIERIDQHDEPDGVLTFRIGAFEYFYELHEKQRQDGNWDVWYQFSLAMRLKRFDKPVQDQWPEPPIDEAY